MSGFAKALSQRKLKSPRSFMDNIDETMSEEMAFSPQNNTESPFKFDGQEDESASDFNEEDTNDQRYSDSSSSEDKQDVVDSEAEEAEEENRIPYSRFKHVKEELDNTRSTVQTLEERLSQLESLRAQSNVAPEDIEVPKEWVELYGDSDVSKRAYKIQLQREEAIQANAVKQAVQQLREEAVNEVKQLEVNEEIIDDGLDALQMQIGKRLSPEVEEAVLTIVDEFSPTGTDGKYLSLFPFDSAYEIYQLRNSQNINKTARARNQVAELTGNNSEGDVETSSTNFKRGWDSWREEL